MNDLRDLGPLLRGDVTQAFRGRLDSDLGQGKLLHDRIIGALELCCRRGEMLMIQNKRVNWESCQIGIPGATTKDKENRRVPFNPKGRIAAILERRAALGPDAFVFGSANGAYQPNIQTAWERKL
jgi:integrase